MCQSFSVHRFEFIHVSWPHSYLLWPTGAFLHARGWLYRDSSFEDHEKPLFILPTWSCDKNAPGCFRDFFWSCPAHLASYIPNL